MKNNTNISAKLFATIFAIFFTGIVAFAQESFNNSFLAELKSELEMIKIESAEIEAAEYESEMIVEEWMVVTEAWTAISSSSELMEEELRVEKWMVSPFMVEEHKEADVAEDELFDVEDWMTDTTSWNK